MTFALWCVVVLPFASPQDTVALAEVAVHAAALDRFAAGQTLLTYEKSTLARYAARPLGDLLQETSPIFVRQYGAGMLASPSFRGTSPGHTALFWNGVPINSISLGQSDLSILPIQGTDRVEVQFGSAGALFGNEAIGGSVHLSTAPTKKEGLQGAFSQTIGSFGLNQTALTAAYGNPNLRFQSKVYNQDQPNTFRYRDISRAGAPWERQSHAAFKQRGVLQDVWWQANPHAQVKTSFWWNQAQREIQPLIGSSTQDTQADKSIRAVIDYQYQKKSSLWKLKGAWVADQLHFNEEENQTSQGLLGLDWELPSAGNWAIRAGTRGTWLNTKLSAYTAIEQRWEAYQGLGWQKGDHISVSINLRQLAYPNELVPFLPGLGLDWRLFENDRTSIQLKTAFGLGLKLPTLNDRYWEPGGNPNLRPEKSQNGELGFQLKRKGTFSWSQRLTYYQMQVDDWILWLPKGALWTPENIREVHNQGLEYQGESSWTTGHWNWQTNISYTYSSTRDLGQEESQQLPYSPKHQGNAGLQVKRDDFALDLSGFYVGQRSIASGDSRILEGFALGNLGISYSGTKWKSLQMPLRFQVLNVFNQSYQVLYLRAMPGRSYQLNLTLTL
uniref:TonB-dependent receptor plug domain-containing protein n=1 Tax=Algoriphagus sp. TaxID=1872435 RepID=UPI0040479BC1